LLPITTIHAAANSPADIGADDSTANGGNRASGAVTYLRSCSRTGNTAKQLAGLLTGGTTA